MKVLVTGFDPFGGESINPSWEAVKLLPDRIGEINICKLQVPTAFSRSMEVLKEALLCLQPDAVISVGQAGGRSRMTVERIAINCMDARIADNEGLMPVDEAIEKDGVAAYFSTLPIKKMVEAMQTAGIPAAVSDSAGTYVCNRLMYGALDAVKKAGMDTKCGFIHVPYLPAQAAAQSAAAASMALDDIVTGLTAAIRVLE